MGVDGGLTGVRRGLGMRAKRRGSSGRSSGTSGEAGGGLQRLPDGASAGGAPVCDSGGLELNWAEGMWWHDQRKEERVLV